MLGRRGTFASTHQGRHDLGDVGERPASIADGHVGAIELRIVDHAAGCLHSTDIGASGSAWRVGMGHIPVTSTKTGVVHIEGFPNAAKLVALGGKQAELLGHLALHRRDLQFALECLVRINETADDILREAAWRSAVVSFVKCFVGGGRRSRLDVSAVYTGNKRATSAFSYFKNLRDKHFVHDENAHQQCHSGAVVNLLGVSPKIDRVVTLLTTDVTLDQSTYNNLHTVATDALRYVVHAYDKSAERLTAVLEAEDYSQLIRRPDMTCTLPPPNEVSGKREAP